MKDYLSWVGVVLVLTLNFAPFVACSILVCEFNQPIWSLLLLSYIFILPVDFYLGSGGGC